MPPVTIRRPDEATANALHPVLKKTISVRRLEGLVFPKFTFVVRVGYGVDESAGDGSEGANDAIVPYGDYASAIVSKAHTGAVEVVNHDAEQLLLATRRPDADALLARRGKDTRVVP